MTIADCPLRTRRGGSWWNDARFARAACRNACGPSVWDGNLGLRLMRRHTSEVNMSKNKQDNVYLLNPNITAESRENGYVASLSIADKSFVRRLLLRNEALQQEVRYLTRVLYLACAFMGMLTLVAMAAL